MREKKIFDTWAQEATFKINKHVKNYLCLAPTQSTMNWEDRKLEKAKFHEADKATFCATPCLTKGNF